MKVKMFSHNDLDGIGCGIIGKLTFSDIDIEYCNYDDINDKIKQYIELDEYKNYGTTFITDISVNKKVAELIDKVFTQKHEFVLLDHHKTALWLNDYKWARVLEAYEDIKMCGTQLLHENVLIFYADTGLYAKEVLLNARNFVETVRQYDTYEFKTKFNNIFPKQVNDLMYLIGKDEFISKVLNQLMMLEEFKLTDEDYKLLQRNQEKIDKYIESKNKGIIIKQIQGYKAGVVFAEQYHSELGNKLSEMHPELDFIVMINPSYSISYRTVKKDIDVSVVAKFYGGGGHPPASGSPIGDYTRSEIIDLMFGKSI